MFGDIYCYLIIVDEGTFVPYISDERFYVNDLYLWVLQPRYICYICETYIDTHQKLLLKNYTNAHNNIAIYTYIYISMNVFNVP